MTAAAEVLDRAIAAEMAELRTCETPDCRDTHLDLINDYRSAQTVLADDNPNADAKRVALATLYTARSHLGTP